MPWVCRAKYLPPYLAGLPLAPSARSTKKGTNQQSTDKDSDGMLLVKSIVAPVGQRQKRYEQNAPRLQVMMKVLVARQNTC